MRYAVLGAVLAVVSCGRGATESPGPRDAGGRVTASVGGREFRSGQVGFTRVEVRPGVSTVVGLAYEVGTRAAIGMRITAASAPAVIPIGYDAPTDSHVSYIDADGLRAYTSDDENPALGLRGTGTITLTTWTSNRAAGTFSFTGVGPDGSKSVSGAFDVGF